MTKSVVLEYNNEQCIIERTDGGEIHQSMIDMYNTDRFKQHCFNKIKIKNRWRRCWTPNSCWTAKYIKKPEI